MKKFLCLILSAVILVSAAVVFTVPAAAASSDKLIVTDGNGTTLAEVEVGNEFIYRVGLYTGPYLVYSGQAEVQYNSKYVQIVEYGPVNSKGKVNMDAYCFVDKVRNTNLVTNYFDVNNYIYYNFSKYSGIEAFSSADDHYFKIRFKAIAPGTVNIKHYMEYMTTYLNGSKVGTPLFRLGKANTQLDSVPYTLTSAEPATAYIGDADGDYELTVMDATFIQRASAGVDCTYNPTNADVNKDGNVNLKDALIIERYKAGLSVNVTIDEWIFASEQ